MPLCKLLYQEIQRISGFDVDPAKLGPRECDIMIDRIPKEIEKLEQLKKILSLPADNLAKVEATFTELIINNNNLKINDLFASRVEDITEATIFYDGDLDFNRYIDCTYTLVNIIPNKLPERLKYIFGKFGEGVYNVLESIDIEYVLKDIDLECWSEFTIAKVGNVAGKAIFYRCFALKSAIIGDVVVRADFSHSDNLGKLVIGHVGTDLFFDNCKAITLNNINSTYGQHIKIKVGNKLRIKNSGLANCTDEELLGKFDVDPNKIVRN